MKPNRRLQHWLSSAVVGVILATPSLGLAANVVYSFDSDVQGWTADGGHGSVVWDGTHGRGGNGCLKYTLTAGDTEIDPRVTVNYDTTTYFTVECDILVDPVSGTDGNGKYGNLQLVARDAGSSWDSMWYGDLGGPGGNFSTWHHVKRAFVSNYGPKASLQFQISAGSGTYSGDVIVYVDNVVIQDGTPGTMAVLSDYAWPEEVNEGASSWTGGGASSITLTQDTNAAPLHPDGSLKMQVAYQSPNTGWQEGDYQYAPYDWDPSKFTYLDFDLYLDAPTGLSTYGIFQVFQINGSWQWVWIAGPGLSEANIGKWTHYSVPLSSGNLSHGFVFQVGGGMTSTFTYYVDNVKVWKNASPPTLKAIRFEDSPTGQGAELTMNLKNNQYQREAICVPAVTPDYSWVSRTPITYSFTITNFPDAVKHSGFEAHLFIVNESTIPDASARTWNETYGGCDWNAADLLKFTVENNAAGGVIVRLNWKTNAPAGNPPNANEVVTANGSTANGTWSLNFDTDSTGTITGPGGFTTNFSLPQGLATQFDPNGAAQASFVQLGMGQNDNAGNNKNYNASGIFTAFSMSGGLYAFNETFPGPDLSGGGIPWRTTTTAGAVEWVPGGTALWLNWTTPDDGYTTQVSSDLKTWSDAGVTYTYPVGDQKFGAVPASNLPGGNAAFFRLKK